MFKFLSPLAIAGAILSLACLGTAPAQALSKVTFVSGKGTDSGTCADPANPCRTFQFAVNQTSASGEVKALDPANYGHMVLTQSISISGVGGAGIERHKADAITINAGPNDVINLSHLILDGLGVANNGIQFNSGGSLTITHCSMRNFVHGIVLNPTTSKSQFLITDTLISDNSDFGILVFVQGTGSAIGTLDHVSMNKNHDGLFVNGNFLSGAAVVNAIGSIGTNNIVNGFVVQGFGVLRLAHSVATGNSVGVEVGGGTVESFGDNDIHKNGKDVDGTLTDAATQ